MNTASIKEALMFKAAGESEAGTTQVPCDCQSMLTAALREQRAVSEWPCRHCIAKLDASFAAAMAQAKDGAAKGAARVARLQREDLGRQTTKGNGA